MPLITPSETNRYSPDEMGGKGWQLLKLSRLHNIQVPAFAVIPVKWFKAHMAQLPPNLLKGLGEEQTDIKILSQRIDKAVTEAAFTEGLKEFLLDTAEWFRAQNISQVSVRSSATSEDSGEASHAGQFSTYLHVPVEVEALADHIRKCWASCFSERLLVYQRTKKIPPPSMAVVLQRMIPSEIAGVGFSLNPATGNTQEMVLSATYGVGEGIVSGKYSGDTFTVSRESPFYREEISDKNHQLVEKPGAPGEVVEIPVPAAKVKPACLDASQVLQLRNAIGEIEAGFQCPVDIEFAFQGGVLYLLQTRAITAASEADKAAWGEKILWDNSNIVESYNGITLPLTFSFINYAYQQVYEQFGRMLGLPRSLHEANQRTMRNYLGLIRGRVYYNLFTWYRSFSYLPFFKYTTAAMEAMMGLPESVNIKSLPQESGSGLRSSWAAKGKLLGRCLYYFFSAQKVVGRFQSYFAHHYALHNRINCRTKSPQQLLSEYENLDSVFLKKWQAPILADTLAMVFYKALESLSHKWIAIPGIQNDLLSAQGEVESTEPTQKILEFFKTVKDNQDFKGFLDKNSPETLARLYFESRPSAHAVLWNWMDTYLEAYGSRSMNELKLEVPTLSEDPSFIFKTLNNYFSNPELALKAFSASGEERKQEAVSRVNQKLGINIFKKKFYHWILNKARQHIRNREAMRLARSRIYGLVRRIFVGYGHTLYEAGLIESPKDVFYLTIPELQSYSEGRSVTLDLASLIAIRKKEYAEFEKSEPDDRFFTIGLPYFRQTYASARALNNTEGNVLRGTCCCPGQLTGRVRVISDPEGDLQLNGEILVASRTDPGWIPLYPSISGLLIEKGSVLSHSAIVAREMGIPTIVGLDNLLNRVQDGDNVTMDAVQGTVTLEDKGENP